MHRQDVTIKTKIHVAEDLDKVLGEMTGSPDVVKDPVIAQQLRFMAQIVHRLPSNDLHTLDLARDIAKLAFSEECKKGDILEQRAFGLMQFAKVGLTTVAGVAGVMTIGGMADSSFRECLLFWLLVSSCFLFKLFYRGTRIINLGVVFFGAQRSTFHRPDPMDIYLTQKDGDVAQALKKHIARMILYLQNHTIENARRVYQYKCCFVNTLGFLGAILTFSAMIVAHQLWPALNLVPPGHQVTGTLMVAIAFGTDFLFGWISGASKERDEPVVMY